jgi:hypothetical protein
LVVSGFFVFAWYVSACIDRLMFLNRRARNGDHVDCGQNTGTVVFTHGDGYDLPSEVRVVALILRVNRW